MPYTKFLLPHQQFKYHYIPYRNILMIIYLISFSKIQENTKCRLLRKYNKEFVKQFLIHPKIDNFCSPSTKLVDVLFTQFCLVIQNSNFTVN